MYKWVKGALFKVTNGSEHDTIDMVTTSGCRIGGHILRESNSRINVSEVPIKAENKTRSDSDVADALITVPLIRLSCEVTMYCKKKSTFSNPSLWGAGWNYLLHLNFPEGEWLQDRSLELHHHLPDKVI